ncbi:hypothetical protein, conserved [Eimeria necatrix]|uniref:Uncharacterized protein n=1 Tax=Eimeria necatrix TaxID=51315 RepID=U6MSW3_9EIME|nr:hypothetical protein, conserved [Eimeria necatrix]CDJ67096.1 hypothetical protein, conserved [Eimeria necatrix]
MFSGEWEWEGGLFAAGDLLICFCVGVGHMFWRRGGRSVVPCGLYVLELVLVGSDLLVPAGRKGVGMMFSGEWEWEGGLFAVGDLLICVCVGPVGAAASRAGLLRRLWNLWPSGYVLELVLVGSDLQVRGRVLGDLDFRRSSQLRSVVVLCFPVVWRDALRCVDMRKSVRIAGVDYPFWWRGGRSVVPCGCVEDCLAFWVSASEWGALGDRIGMVPPCSRFAACGCEAGLVLELVLVGSDLLVRLDGRA